MNRAELLERNERTLAELLDAVAERRARDHDPHIDVREWTTPPREAPPDYITRADVDRIVANAIRQSDEYLIERLADVAQVIGEEVRDLVTNPLQARLAAAEKAIEELKARQWAATSTTIIRP
jgi:hypothetical protein